MPPAEGLATHGESESTRSRKAAGNAIRQEGVQAWYRAAKVFFLRVPTWWCGGEGNIPASIKRDGGGPCVVVDPQGISRKNRESSCPPTGGTVGRREKSEDVRLG